MSTKGKRNVQTKSFDDDFDSDADDDVPEPSAKKPSTAVKDESEDDSDFEDPDLIEIPGEIKTLKSGESAQSMPSFDGLGSSKKKPKSEDDLQILQEIPGKSGLGAASLSSLSSLLGSGGSISGAGGTNPFFNTPSLLQAQDPYFSLNALQPGSSSAANSMDILQKSMQNGGLSSILNNYNFLSGGGITGTTPNAGGAAAAGASSGPGASLLKSNNLYPQLNRSQISNLWNNGPAAGLLGSIPRGPYGNFGGAQYMPGRPGMMGPGGALPQEDDPAAEEDEEDMGVIETYSNYWPSKLKIGKPHPDPVVETASLASVEPPDVWYDLSLPEDTVNKGKLSALQLEAVTYSCQQHEQFLASGERAGFLIGDGAGVGKGRTIAGIILENFLQGRKKAIWVSVSNDLKYDAERDLRDIGSFGIDVHFLSKMKYGKINSSLNGYVKKGVMYATYSALIGESPSAQGKYKSRLSQLLHWCGPDYDGCIVFDECHRAKNLWTGSSSGGGKPTKTGLTVMELQKKLPKARIVYASATGATEPRHMAYMVRLGIWGPGSPFTDFGEFLAAVEKRGVGAMEIVAMDMKLRGMYIARQLSFQGVQFRIDEVELPEKMKKIYNESVKLWVELLHKFEEAAELISAEKKMRKTMWGQYWSSHQRFFKYLCIASKVHHVVKTASEVIKMGKCVVIGLQSTGEARTMEAIEREEELTDFVSTAKGVLQSLVEKHFPAPDRDKINRILGIGKPKTILDELGIKVPEKNGSSTATTSNLEENGGKRKRRAAEMVKKKMKTEWDALGSSSEDENKAGAKDEGSDYEMNGSDHERNKDDSDEDVNSEDFDDDDEDDFNPFGSDSEDDDPWSKRSKKKKQKKAKKSKKNGSSAKKSIDPFQEKYAHLFQQQNKPKTEDRKTVMPPVSNLPGLGVPNSMQQSTYKPPKENIDRACEMKAEILAKVEELGRILPANTLDQLIDELGGPENVSEMTGRKGRVVQDQVSGDVRYESRSEMDIPLETLNLAEKDRFMKGEKDVAIISEAASSGVSLQADRRVANKKRRVHMTLELPWSADRAIQQFGRTHRSNQVHPPEYILLISDLAGEHRFASIVAKRLESLGALTHGDRRATESRDLSRFNIDNKYGRLALDSTFKSIMGYEAPIVPPPSDYEGDFFKDIADGLVGVGLITQDDNNRGVLTLDKGYNDMSKFLNRILGMPVRQQNLLFKYFTDTLNSIIDTAKKTGRYDQGILDVGLTAEDHVELVKTHTFLRKHATGKAKIELHVLHVERGMSWELAKEKWDDLVNKEEGFYVSHQVRNNKKTAILAVQTDGKKKADNLKSSKKEKHFIIYRPNTGQAVKVETLTELKKKYKKVDDKDAKTHWNMQYESSAKQCSHAYWSGKCKNVILGNKCEVGLRQKTYNVLTGSVLSVWTQVEDVLSREGNLKGTTTRMQVVRLKLTNDKRIVGTLIPATCMNTLLKVLSMGSEEAEETIY